MVTVDFVSVLKNYMSTYIPLKTLSAVDMWYVLPYYYIQEDESYSSKVFYDKKRAWMPSKAGIKKV